MFSCRESEEIMVNETTVANKANELSKQSVDESNILEKKSTVAIDSTNSFLEESVKPPIKDGGHWKQ